MFNPSFNQPKIPEVKITHEAVGFFSRSKLDGWDEFAKWCHCHSPVWHSTADLCSASKLDPQSSLKLLCHSLMVENRRQFDLLMEQGMNNRIFIQANSLTRWQKIKMLAKEIITP